MIQSINISWNNEFRNDGLLYFLQRIVEMLDYHTIDIYRAPLMNTPRLINEYLRIANGAAKAFHLEEVFHEFKVTFASDVVIQFKWGEERVQQILNKLNREEQNRKVTMEYLSHAIGTYYLAWVKEYVRHIVVQNNKKDRIEQAIRCLIPEILKCGYSREEIFYSARELLSDESDPSTALNAFLDRFDCHKRKFAVYFQLSQRLLQFKETLEARLGVTFEDDGCFNKLDAREKYCIGKLDKVKALDAVNAANQAIEILELFTAFYQYFGDYSMPLVYKYFLVVAEDGKERTIMVNRGKFTSVEDENPPQMAEIAEMVITRLMSSARCSISKLKQITDLHNRAISNNGLENGFLNLWSIMEMICVSDPEKSKIDQVTHVSVPVLKRDYLPCVFRDIGDNLKRIIGEEQFEELLSEIEEEGTTNFKTACFVILPKYSDKLDTFVDCLVQYPVLRSRLLNLHDTCTQRKDLLNLIERYGQRVSWHLYRIYRARNIITHAGKRPNDLKDLGEHLHSYVDSMVGEMIVKLSIGSLCHISNVILDSEFQQEDIEKYLKNPSTLDDECMQKVFAAQMSLWGATY